MAKDQKSVENATNSQSSSSRVMWKDYKDDEEVFDSVVNYKLMMPSNQSGSNSEKDLPKLSKLMVATESLALESQDAINEMAIKKRAHVVSNWQRLFDRIRLQASPSLALRSKSSHESLQIQRSVDVLQEQTPSRSANPANVDLVTTGHKLETCFFPSYQTVVVREVAPNFAHRIVTPDDYDSSYSQSIMLQTPLLNLSKDSKLLNTKADKKSTPERIMTNGSFAVADDNAKFKSRNKKSVGSTIGVASGIELKGNCNRSASKGNPNSTFQTFKQRQQELHHYRVLIEKRRLELLDLKIVREREDSLRQAILFHKDLQLKHDQIKSFEDKNSSQV